ncbi:hypothetical protein AMAG_20054 [Allomyces macrogynus ATCC 38327]|uniref:Uncharacterized protein n=1 Tax=Allomyces macrogynus (strain ATCC 38327) TaxID=578462 RepID=A0A0L0T511_ALLM3|nr:hypothetical protein AMAG_20054 [Allomyces macrogynus ATCC 38327]|eukprot:KNE69827.1 hypothetical protein AMAG_20054 [Allomyces macrogynus ATCC 38327]
MCTRQFTLIDYWSKTRAPNVPVECRAAVDITTDANRHVPALALVEANPFRSVRDIAWAHPRDRDRYLHWASKPNDCFRLDTIYIASW